MDAVMAEPTQYTFALKEVAECLIRAQGIKDGVWLLSFELGFGAGVFGQTEAQARPGALVQIDSVQLVKPKPNEPIPPWAVDASNLS
jgi:hypothetical protein